MSTPETFNAQLGALVAAAEGAAAAGDFASAAERLREAAALQEKHLGPRHPDLANTLNNLGVVYERAGSPGDAERSYRRAYAIATAGLEPGHPFVATSRSNLQDFCDARGIPFEPERPPLTEFEAPASRKSSRPSPIVLLSVGALAVVVLLIAFRSRPSTNEQAQPSGEATGAAATSPAPAPEPEAEPAPVAPSPVATAEPSTNSPRPVDTQQNTAPVTTAAASPTVTDARLCERLSTGSDWQCDPANNPAGPGSFLFYTRLLSPNDTTVEHRWYRGDRVHQVVQLRIRSNQGGGYRTFSRNTVSAERAGDWRVELRTEDGRLLHEERFSVR